MSREANEQPEIRRDGAGKPLADASPTKDHAILGVALLSAGALVGILFLAGSLYDATHLRARAAQLEESRASATLADHRRSVREALELGTPSIDEAITQLAERGRAAFPQVRPYPSRTPVEGWSRRAAAVTPAAPTPEPVAAAGGTEPQAADEAPSDEGATP